MINSYSKIFQLGHSAIADLLKGPVIVEEKVDGSQFSFWKSPEGELQCRSKGAAINMVAPEGMFIQAVETVKRLEPLLQPGRVYRGEYLKSPKHNTLTYSRIPEQHIIIFEVEGACVFSPEDKKLEAWRIGLECVPILHVGMVEDLQMFRKLLERESVLGGQKIEGVVIKPLNYDLFGRDKKVLMGKFVSEAFQEVHQKTWSTEHKTPGPADIISLLRAKYGTQPRWQKALQHLQEEGKLQNAPQDIPHLMAEVQKDTAEECEEEIKKALWDWCWPQLRRGLAHGLPEWYKEELLKKQFSEPVMES